MCKFTFTVQAAIEDVSYMDNLNANLLTLKPLISKGKTISDATISKCMARKIAGSGLRYRHLKSVLDRSGHDGLKTLLASKYMGKVRVTDRKTIISAIIKHFTR